MGFSSTTTTSKGQISFTCREINLRTRSARRGPSLRSPFLTLQPMKRWTSVRRSPVTLIASCPVRARTYYTQDSVWGGVVLHGVGAKMWWDDTSWLPSFVGIQDILLPTDTDLTMENCRYFAVRRGMKPGSLFKKTFGKGDNMDKGWKVEAVKKLLDEYKELNTNPGNYDWSNNPEQMTELYKQNQSYYDGDSAPMIKFLDFYHLEEENKNPAFNGWYRKLLLDSDCVPTALGNEAVRFIYEKKKPFAQKMDNIIHFQFGDGNNVPPFKYHSIRSLGWLVYDLLWIMNRLNCQFTQHVFEQMMLLFRVQDPNDRDRLQKLDTAGHCWDHPRRTEHGDGAGALSS